MRRTFSRALWILAAIATPAAAAVQTRTDRFEQFLTLNPNGSISIENPNGPITINGADSEGVSVVGRRIVSAVDADAIREGQRQTIVQYAGDEARRFVRTLTPFPLRSQRWEAAVSYEVRVPRTANIIVVNHTSDVLRISNIAGSVLVTNHVNGMIELNDVTGSIRVDTANGNVRVRYPRPPKQNANITSINGVVEVWVPQTSALEWAANTLIGAFFSSLPVRGLFMPQVAGKAYRARLNSAVAPRITTTALRGRAYLLGTGQSTAQAKLIEMEPRATPRPSQPGAIQPVRSGSSGSMVVFRRDRFDGDLKFSTTMGNVAIRELHGNADVYTQAGEIVLGRVLGSCYARSEGGSLNLGDILGILSARATAGDVLVAAARKGGTVTTKAGNIVVTYLGGKTTLFSGGGDITVRQAAAPVIAETRSGDISINMDPAAGSQRVDAKSVGGNVVVNVAPGFAAEIDAVALTPLGEANPIQTDFAGLEISTERVGDMIRTRAVGKINGGGEKLALISENGTIHIRSRVIPPPQP